MNETGAPSKGSRRIFTYHPPRYCPWCGVALSIAPRPVVIRGWFEIFCECKSDPFLVADDAIKLPSPTIKDA